MLLIDCPYCGSRPEIEFTYGGQAHLARPPRPAELDDQQWVEYLYLAHESARTACRALAARTRLRPLL